MQTSVSGRAIVVWAVWLLPALTVPDARAEGWRGVLSPPISLAAEDGDPWARLSVLTDLTAYVAEEPPPGLLFDEDGAFLQPRVGLALDAGFGPRVSVHALLQSDRGFDPGHRRKGDLRFDEYYIQASVVDAARMQLRIGKFVTAFGGWVNRHRSIDNPLISAPVPYADMVTVTDDTAPASVGTFVRRRDVPERKDSWVPVIWGPSYASGASLAAGLGDFDLVLEVKNAALSSRPETWDAVEEGFPNDPTFTGRLAWYPAPEWTAALSHSRGPYLRDTAERTLPPDTGIDDFDQVTNAFDLTFERRQLQIWAEVIASRFEVPRAGDAELIAGFVEVRYKVAPRWWLAGRWNRTIFDEISGSERSWDRHLTRIDIGAGFRQDANRVFKLEYNRGQQSGRNINGQDQIMLQAVLEF